MKKNRQIITDLFLKWSYMQVVYENIQLLLWSWGVSGFILFWFVVVRFYSFRNRPIILHESLFMRGNLAPLYLMRAYACFRCLLSRLFKFLYFFIRFNFVLYRQQKASREKFVHMNAGQSYDTKMHGFDESPENVRKLNLWEGQWQVKVLLKKGGGGTERFECCGILRYVDW
jgi:hypothetical protein